ncbi:DNA topoisomerase I, mitochondrial isoform X2 [Daktulosphaira vitifoliae]|uniref:DNA topoisomerase I, mitochondrial isoform X2 n=1 Tax=Daktulosphaira vitifoliae TaxID=58002 RepID=UPI0021AAF645|nr:DNA topoisomerase I, mitochondrial isoform X2 [Daktulosphaira vitifoliae]XP_050542425.1 DNA topoisomerase I, mitochondrial isoform X2 [Daktulosphaira vitifoliae]
MADREFSDRKHEKSKKRDREHEKNGVNKKEIKREYHDDRFDSGYNSQIKREYELGNSIKEENFSDNEDDTFSSRKRKYSDNFVKEENLSEDDIPLSSRKRKHSASSEDDIPLSARTKHIKKEHSSSHKKHKKDKEHKSKHKEKDKNHSSSKDSSKHKIKKENNTSQKETPIKSPSKKKKEEEQEVWKWWEEEKKNDGVKWKFLEHKGPVFAPDYEPLPKNVKFYYEGKCVQLSESAEEVATFYAKMLEHDYTTKEVFNKNFFKDWRKCMTPKEKELITDLSKCNFKEMNQYFTQKSEERKAMSKEEKKKIKEENEAIQKEYGFCTIDGHKEKIGNFKIEPPGLFRGRGEHPKMGMLKKRVVPEDVLINCSEDSNIPKPPAGHKWKEVKHDSAVTWLASWIENVQGQVKYVMLNPSSKLKGEKDWQKYETARKLAKSIDKIRENYITDWKSREMHVRQRSVALYFIDKLALRAGNEKDEDQADTVGCCSLRVEHIQLHEELNGKEYVVVFDFLGKDSIRYYNEVPVEKRVFKNLKIFMENKKGSDDLFDRLNTSILNQHLHELMDGLTAKVFRTFNASWTLQQQLDKLTDPNVSVAEKILQYNRANRAVAILCNHQRAIPKTHEKSMGNLKEKIQNKRTQVKEAKEAYKQAKRDAKDGSVHSQTQLEKKKKALERMKEQLTKLEVQETDKEENKTIALGTSKLNYLDPRISVAWCKKFDVPIEKIYNKTQRDKFRWAIDMAGPDYVF